MMNNEHSTTASQANHINCTSNESHGHELLHRDLRNNLRNEAKQARSAMSKPYRAHKSSLICQALIESLTLTLGITGALTKAPSSIYVGVYSAFPEEVSLDDFIAHLYQQGINVAFPCMIKDSWSCNAVEQTMEMRLVDAAAYSAQSVPFLLHPLTSYKHESTELEMFPYIPAEELAMMVVPVVAFDSHNNRLGYGGGNYDRYLTQLSTNCRKIGVAFAEQQVGFIPAEAHDIPLPILSI